MNAIHSTMPCAQNGNAVFAVGWALSELLAAEYGEKAVLPDDDLCLSMPGHTVFVPADDIDSAAEIAARMLPVLRREVARQVDELSATRSCSDWIVEFDYEGYPLPSRDEHMPGGIRFDAMVRVLKK